MDSQMMVLGLGNVLNGDDGLGFYAIRDLAQEQWPDNVCFVHRTEFEWCPLFFRDCCCLLLLDTLCQGNEPGTMYNYNHKDLHLYKECLRSPWLLDAMAFSSVFGEELLTGFVGLEPASRECSAWLTSSISRIYKEFLETARSRICNMLDSPHSFALQTAGEGGMIAFAR